MKAAMLVSILGAVLVALPVPLDAQDLSHGTWTGTLVLTNGVEARVEFLARSDRDVTMNVVGGAASPVTDLETAEDGMRFQWGGFTCSLTRAGDWEFVGSCTTGDGTVGDLTLRQTESYGRRSDVLTTEDLIDTQATNVYDALRRLRPYWIRPRGEPRMGYSAVVMVYVDRRRVGDVTVLRDMQPADVQEVRFYSASEATTLFGTGNEGGVVLVTLRHG
jgi:hypothetical protein